MVEGEVRSFTVGPPEPVGNVGISSTSKTQTPPPTISWDNNCNMVFTVWFGNNSDFNLHTKKLSLPFKIQDPNTILDPSKMDLTSRQWTSIRKLVGDVTGATLYWYVQSQDGLGRRESTDVMNFDLTD